MNHWTYSIALTGVVPATCDAEAGEGEGHSFASEEIPSDCGQRNRKDLQVTSNSDKKCFRQPFSMQPS